MSQGAPVEKRESSKLLREMGMQASAEEKIIVVAQTNTPALKGDRIWCRADAALKGRSST
jgi:hypothetical protein